MAFMEHYVKEYTLVNPAIEWKMVINLILCSLC